MNNKILIISFFLLLTYFSKAQFTTFILTQDENIEIKVRYKEKVSFLDEDFITLIFKNKTNHSINLDSIFFIGNNIEASKGSKFSFNFDHEDYTDNRRNDLDTNWVAKTAILAADTTVEKKINSSFYYKNINDFYIKMELGLCYSFDYQSFRTSNKYIFQLKVTPQKKIAEKEIISYINKNIENGVMYLVLCEILRLQLIVNQLRIFIAE